MTINTIIAIVLIVVGLAALTCAAYVYIRNRSLQEIRADVYQLFLKAEHAFIGTETGQQKMKWVVSKARSLLPDWLQLIISEEFLCEIIQDWFDAVKDLLDDGKLNRSAKEE